MKEPLRWPKNSLSQISSGTAAQLTLTNGPAARPDMRVQPPRQQLLAGARLARQQHARSRSGAAAWTIASTRFQAGLSPIAVSAPDATALRR